eukprot:1113553-Prymnesium_polylepis.1
MQRDWKRKKKGDPEASCANVDQSAWRRPSSVANATESGVIDANMNRMHTRPYRLFMGAASGPPTPSTTPVPSARWPTKYIAENAHAVWKK